MIKPSLAAIRQRFISCSKLHRTRFALVDEQSRERLISILTTGLVLIAAAGTGGMVQAIAR